MVDLNAKDKFRKRLAKLVELKKQDNPDADPGVLEKEVKKELKKKRKDNKKSKHAEVVALKEKLAKTMEQQGNHSQKHIEKAKRKAEAQYFSKLKKERNQKNSLKKKTEDLVASKHCELWCPKNQDWWDEECQRKFDEVWFLAAMFHISLEKSAQNFQEIVPDVCEEYFNFLAKKRFNSNVKTEQSDSKENTTKSKKKSTIEKKFEEIKAQNPEINSEKILVKQVLTEVTNSDKALELKNLKKVWKPAHKPWFDKECQESYSALEEAATSHSLDLSTNPSHFKKFKRKNKELVKRHFELLESKDSAFEVKKEKKKEKREKQLIHEREKNEVTGLDGAHIQNKKIKFDASV